MATVERRKCGPRPSGCGSRRARRGSSSSTSAAAACPRRGPCSRSRQRAAAREVEKVLRSAVANAEANHGLVGDELVVSAAYVDEGPTMKRWRARARGRVARIHKPTCHITVKLAEDPRIERAAPPETEAKPKRAPRKKAEPKAEDPATKPKAEAEEEGRAEAQDTRRRRRRPPRNGSENSSRRPARRRHPRLEVELVHGHQGVRRRTCSRTSRSASTSTRSSRTRACPTS